MAKLNNRYICSECGFTQTKWLGRCPNCSSWGTMDEEVKMDSIILTKDENLTKASLLKDIEIEKEFRLQTSYKEFDRVLGGGLAKASVVLITGSPGIGKSTFLLSLLNEYSQKDTCLYISGEESKRQIKERATRIKVNSENLFILNETRLEQILANIEEKKPEVVVIDSIQTIFSSNIASLPASVSQIRECSLKLIELAKQKDICFFIVGHVTKDGKLAGPKLLEHMVDCVISFEGDENNYFRIVRSTKNRYGSTNEISIFSMKEDGIEEVKNPSEFFISTRSEKNVGSIIVPSIEGSRVILFEIQTLVSKTSYGYPKRIIEGYDKNRIEILLAILSKFMKMDLNLSDIYVNIPGGVEIKERSSDLALIFSLISSIKKIPISAKIAVIGEIGLRGELRATPFIKKRVNELVKLGFTGVYLPYANKEELENEKLNIKLNYINNIEELVERIN
ncbi:DNA repair protein RadA [Oceanivirga miroungae]|uniref:DNA repair protein RadA n=1 Tax=Oceanivirga miroungae TaxID=1130046 RepID=A0A6I8MCD4_9FUSO|nr:DNA repair protein RadA [Oceanivirga miroungae]VWL84769.1 DNA repair protein RadA [Oceanivirga miroungae]